MPIGAFKLNGIGKFTVTAAAEVIRAKKPVSAYGVAQTSTAQSKFGGSSALVTGATSYLKVNQTINFSNTDYTIEAWVYMSSDSGYMTIIDFRTTDTDTGVFLGYHTSNYFYVYYNGSITITGTNAMTANTWYHIALSRSSGVTKLFLNGTQEGSSWTDSNTYSARNAYIGSAYNSASSWTGYIDELRISDTARYTGNFTAPTAPHENDNNTLLLLHMDGTNTAQVFEDDNGVRAKKGIVSVGTATTNSIQSKFGGTSLYLNQPAGHKYLMSSDTGFALGSGDFTVEYWWIANSYPASNKRWIDWGFSNTANAPILFTGNSNTRQLIWYKGNGSGGVTQVCATGTTDLPVGAWAHIAIVRSSGTTKIYVDGVEKATASDSTNYTYGGTWRLGFDSSGVTDTGIDGWIDEVRISNTARYTGAFTPSTTRFTNDSNTLLLLHMDGENGDTFFRDDNGGNSPLNGTQFDSGEYLRTTTMTNALSSTSKTATVSFWIKLNNATITDFTGIWGMTTNASVDNRVGLNIFFRSTNSIVFYGYKGVANGWVMQLQTPTNFLTVGEWTHIVLSYDRATAGKFACYKNGQAVTLTNTRFNNDVDGWNTGTRVGANCFAYDGTLNGAATSLDQFWLDDTYIDLSIAANLEKYYKNGMVDMGANGTGSGLSQPMIYHYGGPATFAKNNGRTTGTNVSYTMDRSGTISRDPVRQPLTVTALTSTTTTTSTITVPSTAAAGDLAVLFDTSTTTTDTTPTGWTSISGVTTTGIRTNISYKILNASDVNTSVTGMAGTTRKIMVVYRGDTGINQATATVIGSQATTAIPTNQSLTGEEGPMIAFAVYASTGAITTRGWSAGSPTEYSSVSTSGIYAKALITNSGTPSTTTISMSDGGTNTLQSFRLKIT